MNKRRAKKEYEYERKVAKAKNHQMVVFRRNQAYKAIKEVLLERGLMNYPKHTGGYDRFMKGLAAGEYRLELVENKKCIKCNGEGRALVDYDNHKNPCFVECLCQIEVKEGDNE